MFVFCAVIAYVMVINFLLTQINTMRYYCTTEREVMTMKAKAKKKALGYVATGVLEGIVSCACICSVPLPSDIFFDKRNKYDRIANRALRVNNRGRMKNTAGYVKTCAG